MSDIVYCPPDVDCPCYARLVEESRKAAARIAQLEAALRFWCDAYKSGQNEPLVIAYESTLAKFPALEERT